MSELEDIARQMMARMDIKGSIGSADDFWNAMRTLRRTKAEAERQHDRELKRLRR